MAPAWLPFDIVIGEPISLVTRWARSSACSASRSASRRTAEIRSSGGASRHARRRHDSRAASTARSTSAAVTRGIRATTSSVVGETTSTFSGLAGSVQRPPIRIRS